jgi:hypothetical protein
MNPDPADTDRSAGSCERQRADSFTPAADAVTGLPWLRTWRRVYLFVLGSFALWVALLLIFGRLFA